MNKNLSEFQRKAIQQTFDNTFTLNNFFSLEGLHRAARILDIDLTFPENLYHELDAFTGVAFHILDAETILQLKNHWAKILKLEFVHDEEIIDKQTTIQELTTPPPTYSQGEVLIWCISIKD